MSLLGTRSQISCRHNDCHTRKQAKIARAFLNSVLVEARDLAKSRRPMLAALPESSRPDFDGFPSPRSSQQDRTIKPPPSLLSIPLSTAVKAVVSDTRTIHINDHVQECSARKRCRSAGRSSFRRGTHHHPSPRPPGSFNGIHKHHHRDQRTRHDIWAVFGVAVGASGSLPRFRRKSGTDVSSQSRTAPVVNNFARSYAADTKAAPTEVRER